MAKAPLKPLLVPACALAIACGGPSSSSTTKAPPELPPPTPPTETGVAAPSGAATASSLALEDIGLSSTAMDSAADPCEDFFQYACGGWLAETEIPGDRSSWGRGFSEIHQRNELELHRILEQAVAYEGDDPVTTALGSYYAACMNEDAIEAAGTAAIDPLLAVARSVKRRRDIAPAIARLHRAPVPHALARYGVWPLFRIDVDQDFVDPDKVIAHFTQAGLGLPDRDYYLSDDPRFKALRDGYRAHVERMMALLGMAPAAAKQAATDVLALETALAAASLSQVEMRNPEVIYNKVDARGLAKLTPAFDWKAYYAGIGAPGLTEISVSSEAFFAGIEKQLRKQPARVWRNYLQWQLVHALAPTLPKAFGDQNFAFVSQLTGQQEQPERWKQCIAATDNALPHYLGQAYVAAMFGPEQKAAVEMMVGGISAAFAANVSGYDWMDDATKAKALEKREMMAYLIGYPSAWHEYDFELVRDDFAANTLAATAWHASQQLAKLGKPVDRGEWMMSPATVNAYYHPLKNHMVYPAAILQPPFYSPDASLAVNLGGLGMIVGHELTHGFDDSGAKFAGNGALENWWTPSVAEKFEAKTQCIAEQYAAYEVLPDTYINGELTLGENIADLGGVKLAYQALQNLREGEPEQAGGFDADQQFFLAVGQAWCSKYREQALRMRLQTDSHSPARYRVNGSLANMPAFAEAFSCQKGTAMNREAICSVW